MYIKDILKIGGKMRRPLLGVFVILIFLTFIYTEKKPLEGSFDNEVVIIEGIVNNKIEKKVYDEYEVDKFLVRDYTRRKKLEIGDKLSIQGKFKSLDKMKYEDFDYGRYIKSRGYNGIIYIQKYDIIGSNFIYRYLGNIKVYLRETYRYLYKNNSDFINSILLGEKENLTDEEKDMFQRTGTSHIIAISGLHTGILCVLITFVIGGINRFYKLVVLFIFIFLYCIMVGGSPSIVRSIAFITVLYLSVFFDKKRDGMSTLSLIGTFLVLDNPYIIYSISFQLSFLSTMSIIYFYTYINNIIKVKLISVTLSANILTLPIMYYNFKGISLISIISNMIVVPFIGIIIYLSIVSVMLFKINIEISKFVAYLNKTIINSIYFLLNKTSDLNFAYVEIEEPCKYYVFIYYILIFLYMIYKELSVIKEQENGLQGYYKEY